MKTSYSEAMKKSVGRRKRLPHQDASPCAPMWDRRFRLSPRRSRGFFHSYSLIALAALYGAAALFSAAPSVRLERDAPVRLRLKQALSSETARVNDRVEFEVIEDVSAAGTVVIPKGSTAWGRVADAAPVGRMMRNGRLAVDIESVALADGGSVRLRTSGAAHPGARKPLETTSDGMGALPALPFTMFQSGKGIRIPAGKLVTVYTAAPVTLGSTAEPREVSARSAARLEPSATSASVLPAVNAAPERRWEELPAKRNWQAKAPAPPPQSNDLPVVAQALSPANSIYSQLPSALAADRGTRPPAATSASVLPAVSAAPESAVAADRGTRPPATTSASALPAVNAAPETAAATDRVARVSRPSREPVSVSRGASKKLLTILAAGAAVGLAGVLAAKGHGGAQTGATAPGTTPTTVGIGQINVGGPH